MEVHRHTAACAHLEGRLEFLKSARQAGAVPQGVALGRDGVGEKDVGGVIPAFRFQLRSRRLLDETGEGSVRRRRAS